MAINLIDKIKPKNNGTFAMVDAQDVEFPDGKRLPEKIAESTGTAPESITNDEIDAMFSAQA